MASKGADDERPRDKKVSVVVRIRPRKETYGERYEAAVVEKVDQHTCICVNPSRTREQTAFSFDNVFDEWDSQEEVYQTAVADMALSTLEGVNNVILTYGQTASGKTYTLLGNSSSDESALDSDSGIFLRVMADLLQYKRKCGDSLHLVICLSVIEIYNDQLRDLLNHRAPLVLREHGDDVLPVNPTVVSISTWKDVQKAFRVAKAERAVASTAMNDVSSRSHAFFTIDLLQQRRTARTPDPPSPSLVASQPQLPSSTVIPFSTARYNCKSSDVKPARGHVTPFSQSKDSVPSASFSSSSPSTSLSATDPTDPYPVSRSTLVLVDLAGSESAKKSATRGTVLQEAVSVNKSLTSLGKVVNSIYANSKHIPFRDSRLTRLLRSSLISDRSRILLIANVAPTEGSFGETSSTLHFGDRLQGLKPPTSQMKPLDSEREMEYLKTLQMCEELGSDLRIAAAQFEYKRKIPAYRAQCGGELKSSQLRAVIEKAYRKEVQQHEEAERRERDRQLQANIQSIVARLEEQCPWIAERKERIRELSDVLMEEEKALGEASDDLTRMKATFDQEVKAAEEPHREYTDICRKRAEKLARLDLVTTESEKLEAEITRLRKEIAEFEAKATPKTPHEESFRTEEKAMRQLEHLRGKWEGWVDQVTSYLTLKVKNMKAETLGPDDGDSLEGDSCSHVFPPCPTTTVSPLAYHFDGITEYPQYIPCDPIPPSPPSSPEAKCTSEPTQSIRATPTRKSSVVKRSPAHSPLSATSPASTANSNSPQPEKVGRRLSTRLAHQSNLRGKLNKVLSRIATTKECGDSDGNAILAILNEVRLSQRHLETIVQQAPPSSKLTIEYLHNSCVNEAVAYILRALVLFPGSRLLADKIQDGHIGVLEFVEILLREWQMQDPGLDARHN